ncbi:acyl-ACP--UDP-N-acetylglucosamine O-acyltransferase [Noviherbaspirillum sp. 1P10PC]|uniref:acyl-ACP--UDP-N-acetylglucosamine O-acyltransferase n=1 Tax=Noviherbaspirillum sp. 1P10PC TaxID=3132292 RepID=UPI00399F0029
MALIHPTAIIDAKAELDPSVEVGPYSVIGPRVRIGAGTRIASHVVVEGDTTIGRDNVIYQFCSLGGAPQDKKYRGEPTRLEIGDRNTIREYCSLNLGTVQDAGVTRLGNDNWILAYVHIAHDCQVGSNTIFSNNATLAGHVHVGDWVIMSGFAAVHQFCKIGDHAFVGMNASLSQDVPPFILAAGTPIAPRGLNIEGLKRRGFGADEIAALRRAYKLIYKSGLTLDEARAALAQEESGLDGNPAGRLRNLRAFLDNASRGIVR